MRKIVLKILVISGLRRICLQKNRPFAIIFGFIPLVVPRKGFSPHIPATRLFVHFHPSNPTIHRTPPFHPKQKEQSLLVLPSVHTILNFATELFEMFTKLQSEHPHKVFRVFQVFRAN
ncbi:MAG: hypothetical protein SOX83_04035, partial [Sodaliphilus sp.]|nr:hypothetical protein [Sodaliphilus sp.]